MRRLTFLMIAAAAALCLAPAAANAWDPWNPFGQPGAPTPITTGGTTGSGQVGDQQHPVTSSHITERAYRVGRTGALVLGNVWFTTARPTTVELLDSGCTVHDFRPCVSVWQRKLMTVNRAGSYHLSFTVVLGSRAPIYWASTSFYEATQASALGLVNREIRR